jgi:AcrR family transcriptional regulator
VPAARIRAAPKDRLPLGGQIRKLPRQQRSQLMVQAILQAGAETFAKLGYARTTTNRIAQRAGVSVGSLYQYFPNKDSLLVGLMAKHHADVAEVVGRALARLADPATSLEVGLRQLVGELVALHESDPALTKALSSAVLRESPAVDALHKERDEHGQAQQVTALLATRPDIRDGDHAAVAAVLGQTTAQLTRWLVHEAPAGVHQAALQEEVAQMLVRYLKK